MNVPFLGGLFKSKFWKKQYRLLQTHPSRFLTKLAIPLLLIVGTVVSLYLVKLNQDIRQRAAVVIYDCDNMTEYSTTPYSIDAEGRCCGGGIIECKSGVCNAAEGKAGECAGITCVMWNGNPVGEGMCDCRYPGTPQEISQVCKNGLWDKSGGTACANYCQNRTQPAEPAQPEPGPISNNPCQSKSPGDILEVAFECGASGNLCPEGQKTVYLCNNSLEREPGCSPCTQESATKQNCDLPMPVPLTIDPNDPCNPPPADDSGACDPQGRKPGDIIMPISFCGYPGNIGPCGPNKQLVQAYTSGCRVTNLCRDCDFNQNCTYQEQSYSPGNHCLTDNTNRLFCSGGLALVYDCSQDNQICSSGLCADPPPPPTLLDNVIQGTISILPVSPPVKAVIIRIIGIDLNN